MNKDQNVIYDNNTIEFVTVALSFCGLMESSDSLSVEDFIDKNVKVLPLLYLKAVLLPETELLNDETLETFVTETEYEMLKHKIATLLGEKDDYLEVFHPDMPYSDTPVLANISEDLADIYQDLKNFISVFKLGLPDTMNDALYICKENFIDYWGQRLLNALRALHAARKALLFENEI